MIAEIYSKIRSVAESATRVISCASRPFYPTALRTSGIEPSQPFAGSDFRKGADRSILGAVPGCTSVRIPVRQRPQQHIADNAEDPGAHADARGHYHSDQ